MSTAYVSKPIDTAELDRVVASLLKEVPRRYVLSLLEQRIKEMALLLEAGDDSAIQSGFHELAEFGRAFSLRDVVSLASEGEGLLARGATDRAPLRDIMRTMNYVRGWIAA